MQHRDRTYRLLLVFGLALFLLQPTMLTIWESAGGTWAIPPLFVYIFVMWLLIITATALLVRHPRK